MALVGYYRVSEREKMTLFNVDTVGKGLCMELASKGQNIVLVSRTLSKLQTVAKEIEEKYRVKTKVVDIDFSTEARVQERIEAAIEVERWELSAVF